MATITFEYYGSAGPAWTDIGANTLVFAGSGGITTPISVGQWQDETHIGNGDPGTDQCGANHCKNTKYISSTQVDIGGGTVTLNDTNVTQTDCTMRIHFNDAASVTVTAARFFAFNASVETTQATSADIVCFEQGESESAWTIINDDTVAGALTTGSIGGDNAGERKTLATKTAATDHYWYLALSMAPEAVGDINAMDFKVYITYS